MRILSITATVTFAGPATSREGEAGGRGKGQEEEAGTEQSPGIGPRAPAVQKTSAVTRLTTQTWSPGHCWQNNRP